MNERIQTTIRNLHRNNMAGYYVTSLDQLHETITTWIQKGDIVGCGDSVTLEQTNVFELMRANNYTFLDKHKSGLSHEEKREIYLQNFRSNTFLTGANALTIQGELFFIDGNGSRVAPILYGPTQVIVVVGTNKIVSSTKEAISRSRQIAAPLDAIRLKKNTPCTKVKTCIDCHHPERICNDFVCIAGQFEKNRIKVIILEGEYGY